MHKFDGSVLRSFVIMTLSHPGEATRRVREKLKKTVLETESIANRYLTASCCCVEEKDQEMDLDVQADVHT